MEPVEIIRGEGTSDESLAKAIDYVLAIGKYPIVVNDGRGLFTTRVFATCLTEALQMLCDGIDPAVIEQAALQAGYPARPLQLADELNLATMRRIMDGTIAAAGADGTEVSEAARASATVLESMLDVHSRGGKQAGAGFSTYVDGKLDLLRPELRDEYTSADGSDVPLEELIDRFLFIQALENRKCFEEGVIASDASANIGSIFGISFPPWTGGVRQFVVELLIGAAIRRSRVILQGHSTR